MIFWVYFWYILGFVLGVFWYILGIFWVYFGYKGIRGIMVYFGDKGIFSVPLCSNWYMVWLKVLAPHGIDVLSS